MSFLRRAPAIRSDKYRVNFGADIVIAAFTGLDDATGNANVFVLTNGTMDGVVSKAPTGQGSISGTFTNRTWKYNSIAASNYYVKANNVTVGPVTLTQSSGTLGNWTQLSTNLNWGAYNSASDDTIDFQLHISNSASGVPVIDTANVRMILNFQGLGGGGIN